MGTRPRPHHTASSRQQERPAPAAVPPAHRVECSCLEPPCRRSPATFSSAIVHVDKTSRVQTVPPDNTGIRSLLVEWHNQTGCPMLLNTSLNVKGEPIVNDENDALKFEKHYKVSVFS